MFQAYNVNMSTKRIAIIGLMIAVSAIMVFSPLGMIPLVFVSATISHTPTIIIAILEGPLVGAIVGGIFGIITLVRALSPQGVLDPLFLNPLVSVLPRILIGVFAGYTYGAMKQMLSGAKHGDKIAVLISAAVGSMTNTIGALGMLYIIYAKRMVELLNAAVEPIILNVIATSGVVEMIVAVIITFPIVMALKRMKHST